MPASPVTVSVVFTAVSNPPTSDPTPDLDWLAVQEAIQLTYEHGCFAIPQKEANTEADATLWVAKNLYELFCAKDLYVSVNNTGISGFKAAVAGTGTDLSGKDGSFTFGIFLYRGNVIEEISGICGTITATRYDNGVGNERVDASALRVYANNGILHVHGLKAGETLSIYSVGGQLIYKGVAKASEELIPLNAQGIYIVRAGNKSRLVKN